MLDVVVKGVENNQTRELLRCSSDCVMEAT